MIKSLEDAVKKSLTAKSLKEFDADFTINFQEGTWKCYTVAISYRDISLYCDQGTISILVDTYGDRVTSEIFDWEHDS